MSLDAKTLYQLRSAARRGLLENDLILQRFFNRYGNELSAEMGMALAQLLELDDNDLLDLLLSRNEPTGFLDKLDVHAVLKMLRKQ